MFRQVTENSFRVNIDFFCDCLHVANSLQFTLILSDGSVAIPQPCTEDLSADTTANRAGVFFNYKSENHCCTEIKFTDRVVPVTEISEKLKLCTKELVISPGLPFNPTDASYFI